MEVFICTPTNSRLLATKLNQEKAFTESLASSKRGQGDAPKTKTNLKKLFTLKQNTINSPVASQAEQEVKTNQITLLRPIWVGGVVALGLCASLFLSVPKAQAASFDWAKLDQTSKIIASTASVVVPAAQTVQAQVPANDLADNYISAPLVVDTVITPPDPPKQVLAVSYSRTPANYSLVSGPHYFPYGYCTYYVSEKRTVTWAGNAATWLNGARSAGLSTGEAPKPGAILVTTEGGRDGHVAYVESVGDSSLTISEMNYKGFGVVSTRTISDDANFIKGYIY
jgi:surface antigen